MSGPGSPPCTACAKTSSSRSGPPVRPPAARRARVFDVIAKRRWFYLISLAFTIPGLFFILLTPFTDAGLQFTIDYTGGTKWEIRFEDPNVTPDQVEQVFANKGLEAVAITTGSGFIEIKTVKPADFLEVIPSAAPGTSASPGASSSAGASGRPSASGSPAPTSGAAPPATPSATPSASPARSGSPA